jgi:ketosteroid isomerase-like protein
MRMVFAGDVRAVHPAVRSGAQEPDSRRIGRPPTLPLMDTLRRRIVLAAPVAAFAFIDTTSEIDAILDRVFAAFGAMDADALTSLLAPDVIFEDPTFHVRREGRAAVRAMLLDIGARYAAIVVTPHNRVVAGDRAATEQTVSVTVRTAGGPDSRVAVRGASFFEFSASQIRRWTDYYDARPFTEQAG